MEQAKKTPLQKFIKSGKGIETLPIAKIQEIIDEYANLVAQLENEIKQLKKSKLIKETIVEPFKPITIKAEEYERLLQVIQPKAKRNRGK